MKSKLVLDLYSSHSNYLAQESITNYNVDVKALLSNLFSPGPSFYYIIDSPTLTAKLLSQGIEDILSISKQEFSVDKIIELIHPDDFNWFLRCEDVVAYFLKNCVAPEQIVNYKISYCLRLKSNNNEYKLFLLQTLTLKTTEDGALLKVFGCISDINHITSLNNKKLSLIGLNGEPSYLELDAFNHELFKNFKPFVSLADEIPFTSRELEIIKLLGEGLTMNEISQQLNIAFGTVNTHRKNILKKSDCKNITELVADCIRKGYI
ncbi:regulatory LuxR family protein [Flavobacteriaceae bacterium MAR_2010_105]|nr:regulatory LuxR family protein [Flavobacteriaceae bacterium MAR_2010_105]